MKKFKSTNIIMKMIQNQFLGSNSLKFFILIFLLKITLSVFCSFAVLKNNQSKDDFYSCKIKTKSFKILMIVPQFPKISDVCMLNQITSLIDYGHDVYIYAENKGDLSNVQNDVENYKLLEKTFYKEFPENINDFDIVIFQLGHKLFDIRKKHNFKNKLVVCLRGYDASAYIQENPTIYDQYLEICDLFLPVCDEFRNRLLKLGCPDEKVKVLYSAIDCHKFRFKERAYSKKGFIHLVSACRFVEKKGIEYAIIAVSRLIKKYPYIRYTIIGGGPLEKIYRNKIKKLGLSKYVRIINWLPHEQLINILDRSHIFILPSVTAKNGDQEGIPNALKEAMALGLIVIASNHAGNPELIEDKKNGFLVEEKNSEQIVQTVDYIIKNNKEWKRISFEARKKVERIFDKKFLAKKLDHIITSLCIDY